MMDDKTLKKWVKLSEETSLINQELYNRYKVKRGLRNKDHTGVLVGLTHIGDVIGYKKKGDNIVPCKGKLLYRGIPLKDLVKGFQKDGRAGFDETVFLLLFGKLPSKKELKDFTEHMAELRKLPRNFTEDTIIKAKGKELMNMLARCVLGLYTLDENPDDTSVENILKQSVNMIAKFPTIIAYSYNSMRHKYKGKSLNIRHPKEHLSTAENFLYMLKGKKNYTPLEAEILDLVLVAHAEHGGGNNSSFTTHVVSSSGTDTYSAIAASLGSLKGPLHGGANIRVAEMMEDIKENVSDWTSEKEVSAYVKKILDKKAYDKSGKVYGFGHAVYTLSDPRAVLLKQKARELAKEKGRETEFTLYELMEKIVPKALMKKKKNEKIISANVDFYSGFIYECLNIPKEVYTPLFAMSRISGWCAHRLEELISSKRIIRPAYKNVSFKVKYKKLSER